MFIFAIRIHVEYTFPNDGFPIANHLRIQIRAVTVESSFAKSQHLAGCFTFSIYSPNKLFAYHSPCGLPRRAVNTSSDFIWHLEKWLIFDTTGTKKHVSFPQSPLEAARKWAAAKMPRFHHDPVLVKPNDCWASHHFRSSNDPIDIYTVYIYISQSTLLDPQTLSIEIGQLN